MTRRLIAPLVSATTCRRGAFLLLGGVLLLPYGLVGAGLAGLARDGGTPLAVTVVLSAAAAVIGLAPPFLHGARVLEVAAARWLLGVELPDPPGRPAPEARLRGALWFAVHLGVGAVVAFALFVAVPTAAALIMTRTGWTAAWWALLGVALLLATGYGVAGLGALAALMAPVLLGPSADERVAAIRAQARRLAERNRLARDLHDSVGHALTVTVVQAAAAGELLDRDPAFARRALTAIEETARAAMEDLDQVLGLLRPSPEPPGPEPPGPELHGAELPDPQLPGAEVHGAEVHGAEVHGAEPQAPVAGRPDLGDLGRLAAVAGARLVTDGPIGEVPAELSRQAYRVVQESLTNALRHAAPAPVSLRVTAGGPGLVVEVRNPLPGRGLAGMRERVALLGGELVAGPDGDQWRVRAEWHW
ncbi:two-component sensor histidine kinase [Actinoplanes sp. ATCC 53533]|uniref:sensor histidine kinase n=1 Tax=Actinoplanes sp. ATCC 53533 TaxID=1288362 RepID=UPI000F7748EE|nr:histidine kinase [Actinoplanes sp. ATCC 53533]RSM74868.1 two-component sensor histidine kinase [Actinoplanes sp. ATCC 53533]